MASKKPGTNAGKINPYTAERRGPLPLTADERRRARFLRFEAKWEFAAIAADLGRTEEEVRHSLANARWGSGTPKRRAINGSLAAADELERRKTDPDEPMWSVLNRVLGI